MDRIRVRGHRAWRVALWRLIQAVTYPEGGGRDTSGIASRAGHAAAALGYSVLAFTAGQLVVTSGGGSLLRIGRRRFSRNRWAGWLRWESV
ncbi:MAG: hypothetical protein JOZ19_16095 [Rubrobacter sp.]|nr:hypothetical protein [Rubrobacter sp.]